MSRRPVSYTHLNTSAIAVALTNCESVLGYAGYQEAHNPAGIAIRTSATHACIRRGKTLSLIHI